MPSKHCCLQAFSPSPLVFTLPFTLPHTQGNLKEGWRDSDGTDLTELTWKVAGRVSANLTPQLLSS